jgi:putative membrane protein
MTKLILRWAINAVALWVAVTWVPGISGPKDWVSIFGLALLFGLINALLRPLLTLLTCPLIILTLGLGTLLINTFLFWLTSIISQSLSTQFNLSIGFTVDGFWPAFFGALVVSVVSVVLSLFIRDDGEERRRWRRRERE